MQIPSYKQLTKYILGFGGIQSLNILISLVRNKFVSIILGPSGMGLISLFQSGITLMQNSTNFGLSQSGIRTISIAYEDESEETLRNSIRLIRSWSLITAAIGLLASILLSGALSVFVFSNPKHYIDFILLSPVVALAAITSGEFAILKAVRQLKAVAKLSAIATILTLATSVPMYYFWGTRGIIPSIIIAALLQFAVTIKISFKHYPPKYSLNKDFLLKGKTTMVLGIAFVGAGIFSSGAEFLVRAFLNRHGGEAIVGLYNAGYMIAFSYAVVVFASFDNEYFPRLSRVCGDGNKASMTDTIIRQIKVSLLFVVPIIIILIPLLPYIIPILFSTGFNDAIPMAQVTLCAIIIKAITLPIEYMPLAKGDSKSFLLMEAVYDVLFASFVCYFYLIYGLIGTGYAIVLAYALSMLFNITYVKHKYL